MNKNNYVSDINECNSNPCATNATCEDVNGTFICTCDGGYTGDGIESCQGISYAAQLRTCVRRYYIYDIHCLTIIIAEVDGGRSRCDFYFD